MKDQLFGKNLSELQQISLSLGLPKFTGKQLADWLYKKGISSIDEMSNLSIKARVLLNENYEFGLSAPSKVQVSIDGTKKYLFPTSHNKFIETAMIPDDDRKTVCVSNPGWMQNGMPLLYDWQTGISGTAYCRRDCEPDPEYRRVWRSFKYRLHGNGRTFR